MTDLTISDALNDPMIGLLLEADNISRRSFAQLLESAARVLAQGDKSSFELSHYQVSESLAHLPYINQAEASFRSVSIA
jgi:hypothetical protein